MYTIAFLSPMVDGPMDAWEVSCCTSRISWFPKVPAGLSAAIRAHGSYGFIAFFGALFPEMIG